MADDAPLSPDQLVSAALPSILDRARVVITPYPFGVSDADFLRVVAFSSLAGVQVNIQGRQAAPGVDSKPFDFAFTPTGDRAATVEDFTLGGGFVTNLTVYASGVAPTWGQTFVIVQLVRAQGTVAFVMGTLLAGYITARQNLGWPGSPIQSSLDGPGYTYATTLMVAGDINLVTIPTPAGARWDLQAFQMQLQTDATPGNRRVELYEKSPTGDLIWASVSPQVIGPSTSRVYSFAPGFTPTYDGNFVESLPLPRATQMAAGYKVGPFFTNKGATDALTSFCYTVREWLEAQS